MRKCLTSSGRIKPQPVRLQRFLGAFCAVSWTCVVVSADRRDNPLVEPTRLIRWLRISVSAVSFAMFVGLSWLWARSYSKHDIKHTGDNWRYLDSRHSRLLGLGSREGGITLSVTNRTGGMGSAWLTYGYPTQMLGFAINANGGSKYVKFPHWFLILLTAALATVPWLPWMPRQFSLRNMFIVTTVVAAVLGMFVWQTR